jgi:very-short-patch-repair endonuclease
MDLPSTIRRQDGLITHEQARRWLSRWAISRKVADDEWDRVHPRTYLDRGHPKTGRTRIRASALWAGPAAVVVGRAAAHWWRLLDDPPDVVELHVPPTFRRSAPHGVRLIRRPVAEEDRCTVDAVTVTTREVTVLDAAVELGGEAGRSLLDRAVQQHLSLEHLLEAHRRRPRRRHAPEAAELLCQAQDGTASEPERRVRRLMIDAGITGFETNWEIRVQGRRILIDLAFPSRRLAVEIRGWAFHRDHDRYVADSRRRNLLVLDGWTVLEFTWEDVVARPAAIVAQIVEALAATAA